MGIVEEMNADFARMIDAYSRPLTTEEVERVRDAIHPAALAECGRWDNALWFCPPPKPPRPNERSYSFGASANGTLRQLTLSTDTTQGGRGVTTVTLTRFA